MKSVPQLFSSPFWKLLIAFIFTFQGCDPQIPRCIAPKMDVESFVLPQWHSTNVVNIYVDATLSMKGFTEGVNPTVYQRTLPALERAANDITAGKSLKYFRFGTTIEEINRENFRNARSAEFYPNTADTKDTLLQNVVATISPNELTVIVTDLFQDKSDINAVKNVITPTFIKNRKAIGVLGLKSQFAGVIYDAGDQPGIPYNSTEDKTTFRPFYLMLLGPSEDVTKFLDVITQDTEFWDAATSKQKVDTSHRFIMSPFVISAPTAIGSEFTLAPQNGAMDATAILVEPDADNIYSKEWVIPAPKLGSEEKVNISFDQPVKFAPSVAKPASVLDSQLKLLTCTSTGAAGNKAFSESQEPPALTLESTMADSSSWDAAHLSLSVDPTRLSKGVVHRYEITLYPKLSIPTWISEWTLTDGEFNGDVNEFRSSVGTKTYQLETLFQTIWGSMAEEYKPKLSSISVYLRQQ